MKAGHERLFSKTRRQEASDRFAQGTRRGKFFEHGEAGVRSLDLEKKAGRILC